MTIGALGSDARSQILDFWRQIQEARKALAADAGGTTASDDAPAAAQSVNSVSHVGESASPTLKVDFVQIALSLAPNASDPGQIDAKTDASQPNKSASEAAANAFADDFSGLIAVSFERADQELKAALDGLSQIYGSQRASSADPASGENTGPTTNPQAQGETVFDTFERLLGALADQMNASVDATASDAQPAGPQSSPGSATASDAAVADTGNAAKLAGFAHEV